MLDTAAFVTAVRSSNGAAGKVLRMIFRHEVIPLMSLGLALEYRDVALRAEHVKVSKLNQSELLEIIEAVEAFAEPVEVIVKIRPLSIDPNDDMVLDIAMNGSADAIVTNNTKHFANEGKRYGISVLTPAELLERMRRGTD